MEALGAMRTNAAVGETGLGGLAVARDLSWRRALVLMGEVLCQASHN